MTNRAPGARFIARFGDSNEDPMGPAALSAPDEMVAARSRARSPRPVPRRPRSAPVRELSADELMDREMSRINSGASIEDTYGAGRGTVAMKKGGVVKKMAAGGKVRGDGMCRVKTKGRFI